MLRLGCVLILGFYTAYVVLAFKYLPVGWAIVAILGLMLFTLYAVPKLLVRGATGWIQRKAVGLMDAKSAALRDATLTIESIEWVARSDAAEQDYADEEAEPLSPHVLRVVATIRPAGSARAGRVLPSNQTPMQFYEPGEFVLVPEAAKPIREQIAGIFGRNDEAEEDEVVNPQVEDLDPEPAGQAHCVDARVTDEAGAVEEADKVAGVRRVSLDFDVPTSLTGRVKPRYYLEDFAPFDLPPRPLPLTLPMLEG